MAQFKFTALLLPSGVHRITGLPFDKSTCKSERSIKDPELNVSINKQFNCLQTTYLLILVYCFAVTLIPFPCYLSKHAYTRCDLNKHRVHKM